MSSTPTPERDERSNDAEPPRAIHPERAAGGRRRPRGGVRPGPPVRAGLRRGLAPAPTDLRSGGARRQQRRREEATTIDRWVPGRGAGLGRQGPRSRRRGARRHGSRRRRTGEEAPGRGRRGARGDPLPRGLPARRQAGAQARHIRLPVRRPGVPEPRRGLRQRGVQGPLPRLGRPLRGAGRGLPRAAAAGGRFLAQVEPTVGFVRETKRLLDDYHLFLSTYVEAEPPRSEVEKYLETLRNFAQKFRAFERESELFGGRGPFFQAARQ